MISPNSGWITSSGAAPTFIHGNKHDPQLQDKDLGVQVPPLLATFLIILPHSMVLTYLICNPSPQFLNLLVSLLCALPHLIHDQLLIDRGEGTKEL